MSKWTIAIIVELEDAADADDARAQAEKICNESSVEFTWEDTIVDPTEQYLTPPLGAHP